jgi:hypothetical protein
MAKDWSDRGVYYGKVEVLRSRKKRMIDFLVQRQGNKSRNGQCSGHTSGIGQIDRTGGRSQFQELQCTEEAAQASRFGKGES